MVAINLCHVYLCVYTCVCVCIYLCWCVHVYMCICVVVCLHVVITEHYIIAVCPACVHLQCMSIFDCVLFAFYFLQTFVTQYGRVVKRRKPPPNVYNDFSVRFYLMRGFICATE